MAAGCLALAWGVARALLRAVFALVAFALSLLGTATFLAGILSLYLFAAAFMPLTFQTPAVMQQVGVAAERFNAAIEPVEAFVAGLLSCTWDDVTDLWNSTMRGVFGVVRAVLGLLTQVGVEGIPNWYTWGDRSVAAARDIVAMLRARAEAERRAAIARDPALTDWERVAAMNRAKPVGERDAADDAANLICTVTDGAFTFLGDVLEIYWVALIDFLGFMGKFYDVVDGFDVSYINIFLRYILSFVARALPFIECFIDIDNIDVTDPSSYFTSPKAMIKCICPAYHSISDIPSDPALMVVGCFCPLNGDTSVVTVLLKCTRINVVLGEFNRIAGIIQGWINGSLNTLETQFNTAKNNIEDLVNKVGGAVSTALDAIKALFPFSSSVREFNGTAPYPACAMAAPRPVRPRQEFVFEPLERTVDLREPVDEISEAFARNQDALRARTEARIERLGAQLARDFAPLLDGTLFMPFADRVAARLGPEAGERAAVMHAGITAFLGQLPAAWRAPTIHGAVAALTAPPEVAAGFAAMRDVVEVHRAARGAAGGPMRRGIAQARTAVRAFLPAEHMAPLVAELRAAGEHAAAADAEAWAGRLDAYAWARSLPLRGAEARRQRDAAEAEASRILAREVAAATQRNSVVVHAGAYGATFVVGIFSSLAYAPGAFLDGFASVLAVLGSFLATGLAVLMPIVGEIASNFFYMIANPDATPRNDLFTPLVNVLYPLIANSFTTGYTEAALQAAFARVVEIAELELRWVVTELLRTGLTVFARPTGMRVGPDGLPDGDIAGWLVDRVLNAPVDEPCLSSADCQDYPCRLVGPRENADDPPRQTRVECTDEWPEAKALCTGSNYACTTSADCAGGKTCVAPATYSSECTGISCAGNIGRCFTPCFVDAGCSNGQCYNRVSFAYDCTPEAPCAWCTCVAFPLRPYHNVTVPKLRAPVVHDCGAVGIDLADLDYRTTDAFKTHGLSWRLVFTWDFVRYHVTCVRVSLQAARALAAWVIASWRVPKTLAFAPFVSNFLLFVPSGPIVAGAAAALGGDFAAGIVGGASGVASFGRTLQGWPWPVWWVGDQLVFIGEYTPTGGEAQCIAQALPAAVWGGLDVFVLYTILTLAFVTSLLFALVVLAWTLIAFPFRVGWAAMHVGRAGAQLSRAGALPSSGRTVYAAAPDAVGVVHRRHRLPTTHPLRHRHVDDLHVLGVRVRPPRRQRTPTSWAAAAHDGLEIGLRAVPHLVARGGRVADDEWFDLLHDEHGRMRDRMLVVKDAT